MLLQLPTPCIFILPSYIIYMCMYLKEFFPASNECHTMPFEITRKDSGETYA